MNKMKIPKEFQLIDELIKVEYDKSLNNKKGHIGFADYAEDKIILDDSDIWKKCQDECFFHELVH